MVRTAAVIVVASALLPSIQALSIDLTKLNLFRRSKTAHLPNFDILTASADRIPPIVKSTISRWAAGQYPQTCYDKAREAISDSDQRPKCQLGDLEVYDVTYEGCDAAPWVMCRCVNAEHSIQDIADGMGTVPHGIRSNVVHVVAMNGFGGGGGGSNNDRIVYGGNPAKTFFSHESMHSNDQGFSYGTEFQAAYDKDTCVPDDYANASPPEDFAQLGTWLNWGINGKEIDPYVGTSADCMKNQLEAVQKWLGDKLPLSTTKCAPRRANDNNVAGKTKRDGDAIIKADPAKGFESLLPHVPYEHEFKRASDAVVTTSAVKDFESLLPHKPYDHTF